MANIDTKKLRDFSEYIDFDIVENDIRKVYNIQNICDDEDESLTYIINELIADYDLGRANYRAYIEKDMDARMLMEVRKSAVIPMSEELYDFYDGHKPCKTPAEVKEFRRKYLKFLTSDYEDLNWQYYLLIKHYLRSASKGFVFDFESCFADGDWRKQSHPEDYEDDFIQAHLPDRLKRKQ